MKRYTLKELSSMFLINQATLKSRCQRSDVKKQLINNQEYWYLNKKEVEKITGHKIHEDFSVEVIYVTRTTEIYPSKLNYLKLNQL